MTELPGTERVEEYAGLETLGVDNFEVLPSIFNRLTSLLYARDVEVIWIIYSNQIVKLLKVNYIKITLLGLFS